MKPQAILALASSLLACRGEPAKVTAPIAPAPTTTATTTAAATTTTAPEPETPCETDVPASTLDKVVIARGFNQADVVAGDALDLRLATPGPGSYDPFHWVYACAKWSVSPPELATIDAKGHVVFGAMAAGKSVTVSATLGNGRVVSTTFEVTKASMASIVGNWSEDARQACGTSTWIKPDKPIRELHIDASGEYTVTWTPFESYVDYVGKLTYDPATGATTMVPSKLNYLPPDVTTKGTAKIEGGQLVLRGIWLGSANGATEKPACAQRFKK
jgi:hypothetical protein